MQKHFLLSFLFFVLFLPLQGLAQVSGTLNLSIEPALPEAGEQYTVTARVSGNSTPRASLIWFVNGSIVESFTDSDTITLTADNTSDKITARVLFTNGAQIEASRTIAPVRVDLIVNSETRTPAFYKGKSLPSSGSAFTVQALVFKNNAEVQSGLSYIWKINGTTQGSGAVRGKNSISYTPAFESEVLVSVEVFDAQNKKIAADTIRVPIVAPEMYFYENNPLRGLSHVALREPHIFVGEEMNIRAEAYYLSADMEPNDVFTEWKINGTPATASADDGQEITIRKEGSRGTSVLSFHIRNLAQLLHGVEESLTIKF